ncbi:polyketide cyclase/dehydrase/lipid transport protein [Curtobacterium flaccumfaciens]|uniref:Polyketide cyclase/dehydrase/lipid transport protein n=1 Tax=Curtobacterium flaccumfaciens TaxID=2035 RepID=A0A4V3BLI5_9MICO|nr:SRPBCC family protein [Curtobacterium flaccumfaciens]TDN46422.1 polyketide cyclase/dehydrase/lipid transport protein [Curtobacterium flaccumfaciens]
MADKTSTIERSTVIAAPADAITPLLANLHRWVEWSPWEGQDPNLQRTYGGEPGSVGSTYAWKGNRKAGAGDMTVTRIAPTEVGLDLRFTAPFKSSSTCTFRLTENANEHTDANAGRTRVVWSMTSPQNLASRVMGVFIDMDKLIGGDFEKGLAKLRAAVER